MQCLELYIVRKVKLAMWLPACRVALACLQGYDAGEDENTEVWFVEAGATLVFTGKVVVAGVTTTRVAINEGSME